MLHICSQIVGLHIRVSFSESIEWVLLFGSFFFPLFSFFFFFGYKTASVMRGMGSSSMSGGDE